jgi:DNA polymerase-3 subunit epsilon
VAARRGERSTRRGLFLAVALAGAGLLALAATLLIALPWSPFGLEQGLALGGGALALVALWVLVTLLDSHFDDLARLTGDVLGTQDGGLLPERWSDPAWSTPEGRRLAQAINQGLARQRLGEERADERLAEVVAAVSEGLLVVTDSGLVSLVNAAAAALFDPPPQVGTSLYRLVHRDSLAEAEAAALQSHAVAEVILELVEGGRLPARVAHLEGQGGLLLSFAGVAAPARGPLQHDLSLHDRPPELRPDGGTRLIDLPVVVLDGETTGLDVARDRLVSIAGVRMHGARLYRQISFDRMVNPGVPIPRGSTAVHGISDRMVERAPDAGQVLPELADFIGDAVVVGHNIGFDLALLAAEATRAGLLWRQPRALDTGHLAAALDPGLTDLNLDTLADRYSVRVEGRHTALGDCLLTAAVWRRLLRELEGAGIVTLAEAEAFARRAERLIGLQRQAGWMVPARS